MWFFFGASMSIFYSIDSLPRNLRGCVLTIGNFDGVHLGHQELLKAVCEIKNKRVGGVLTFSPHFVEFLKPEQNFFRLSSDAQKAELLLSHGADFVIMQKLSEEFLSMSAQEFISEVLQKKLLCEDLIVGDDFCFGQKALGRITDLVSAAKNNAFKLHVIEGKNKSGERYSSSAIRNYLSTGDLDRAKALLGRSFSLRAQVSRGQGIAQSLGFSTANIIPKASFGLLRGVYASFTRVNNQIYPSATNVGFRPSVSKDLKLVIETHILDQKLDLDNLELEIFFIKYIRNEIKFGSLEALKEQVQKDITQIRQILSYQR